MKLPTVPLTSLSVKMIDAYTDGSYNKSNNTVGYGTIYIAYLSDGETIMFYDCNHLEDTSKKGIATMHQVGGELQSAYNALADASFIDPHMFIRIYYDYLGVEKWVTGEWKTKNKWTKRYAKLVHDLKMTNIQFNKVPAHSGVIYNELADAFAKVGCGLMNKSTASKVLTKYGMRTTGRIILIPVINKVGDVDIRQLPELEFIPDHLLAE